MIGGTCAKVGSRSIALVICNSAVLTLPHELAVTGSSHAPHRQRASFDVGADQHQGRSERLPAASVLPSALWRQLELGF